MMLLLMRRPLRDSVTFCAFEKFPEETITEKWLREGMGGGVTICVREEGTSVIDNWIIY